jgi:hypothetical protein
MVYIFPSREPFPKEDGVELYQPPLADRKRFSYEFFTSCRLDVNRFLTSIANLSYAATYSSTCGWLRLRKNERAS